MATVSRAGPLDDRLPAAVRSRSSRLLLTLECEMASCHSSVVEQIWIPLRNDTQSVAIEVARALLVVANPLNVPGTIDRGNPLLTLDAILSRVGHQRPVRGGAFLVGLRGLASIRFEVSHHPSFGTKNEISVRTGAERRTALTVVLKLDVVGQDLPGTLDRRPILRDHTWCHQRDRES